MTYTFERNYDKWETEPDILDIILDDELESENEIQGFEADSEAEQLDFDEMEFDL